MVVVEEGWREVEAVGGWRKGGLRCGE